MAKEAHASQLMIHPFTVRADALPPYAENTEQLFDAIYIQAGAEGLFTDFPDKGIQFLQKHKLHQ